MDNEVKEAKDAANAAMREMYANPGPDTKAKWDEATKLYHRLRYRSDPEWREKRAAAAKRYREKKKLGIPTGPSD